MYNTYKNILKSSGWGTLQHSRYSRGIIELFEILWSTVWITPKHFEFGMYYVLIGSIILSYSEKTESKNFFLQLWFDQSNFLRVVYPTECHKCLEIKVWCIEAALSQNEPHRFYEHHRKCSTLYAIDIMSYLAALCVSAIIRRVNGLRHLSCSRLSPHRSHVRTPLLT